MRKISLFLCLCACFSAQAAFSGGRPEAGKNPPPGPNSVYDSQGFFNDALFSAESAFTEIDQEPTPEDLYYLGRAVAATILASYEPYNGNPELTRYLNLICQAIVINSPTIELFNGSYVLILDSPELNAFASPGGHILITKGLVELTKSEDMLAAIIAHELAHVKLKHGIKMIIDMQFYDEMTAIANRAFDFSGRDSARARRLMDFRGSVTTLTDTMLKNGYSYSQEFEADQEALSLLAAAGYDPGALREVLYMLLEKQIPGGMGINATHPNPVERVRSIERWIRYYRVQDNRRYRVPRFKNN